MKLFDRDQHTDGLLLISALFLVGIGIVMIYSTSSILAERYYHDPYYFLRRQLLAAALGLGVMYLATHFNYEHYRKFTLPLLLLSMALLGIVLIPEISAHRGSRRWLYLAGLSFQPSELAKLAMVIYLAQSLTRKQERIKQFKQGFLPYLLVAGVMIVLIFLEPDLGGALTMGVLVFVMLFAAGTRLSYLISAALAATPVLFWVLASSEKRWQRILAYLDPWDYAQSTGWQLVQSFLAFGQGGIFGMGLGGGMQKLFYLPDAHTDFIFSVIGEELGLMGVVALVLLFGIFITRGIQIALRAETPYGTFLALGIVSMIGIPALFNMAVVLGLLPTKGLVLPFVSYGGSALLINLLALGILLNISAKSSA